MYTNLQLKHKFETVIKEKRRLISQSMTTFSFPITQLYLVKFLLTVECHFRKFVLFSENWTVGFTFLTNILYIRLSLAKQGPTCNAINCKERLFKFHFISLQSSVIVTWQQVLELDRSSDAIRGTIMKKCKLNIKLSAEF